MKKRLMTALAAGALVAAVAAPTSAASDVDAACWGQLSAAFALTGAMGEHASQEETPRLGLYNLAVALYEDGALEEATIAALGAFLDDIDPNLTVEACQ